jgi:hypothetical protein
MQSALTSRISSLDNSVLPRLQINLRKILDGTNQLVLDAILPNTHHLKAGKTTAAFD